MKIHITSGTYDFLRRIKEKHPDETMIIMQNPDTALLLHESYGSSIFKVPRSYEVIDSSGSFGQAVYAVMNNIPVTDEGRPLFEYGIKNRASLIDKEPGFAAIRVLRPMNSNSYVILSMWKDEKAYKNWQNSKTYEIYHEKYGSEKGINTQQPQIFSSPSYITKYFVPKDEI